MNLPWILVLALLANPTVLALSPAKRNYSSHDYYILEHDPQLSSLDDVIRQLGLDLEVVEQVGQLLDHWLVRAEKPVSGLPSRETSDRVLDAFENLRSQAASMRDPHLSLRSSENRNIPDIVKSVKYLSPQIPRQRAKRAPPPIQPPEEDESSASAVARRLGITDPLFSEQWHIVNDEYPEHMMNVTGVWEMGITGKGVITAMVDDGVDYTSKDLAANFVCLFSYGFQARNG